MNRFLLLWCCVLSLTVVTVPAGEAWAASPSIDLSGSTWELNLTGSLTANAPKVGRVKQNGQVDLFFGPNVGEGLVAGEFLTVDPEGDEIYGTHTSSSKGGEELTPNATSLENYIEAKIQSAATGISLMLNVLVKATVDITVDGQPVVSKVSVTLKGKGLIEMTGAGTHWYIPSMSKLNIRGLGRINDIGTLDLILGPDAGEGLAANEFKAVDDKARVFIGTYTVKKGKVTVNLNDESEF